MKQLIKKAFKTIFSNKVFSLILMVIITISSLTYTLLQSSANAFQNSYNQLMFEGNLHDAIIKERFINEGQFDLELQTDQVEKTIEQDNKQDKKQDNKKDREYTLIVKKDYSGDYSNYFANFPNELTYSFKLPITLTPEQIKEKVQEQILNRKEQIEQAVKKYKPLAFKKALEEIYGNELTIKRTQSIAINTKSNGYKFVTSDNGSQSDNESEMNNLVIYDGYSQFSNKLSVEEMYRELIKKINENSDADESNYAINTSKEYKVTGQALNEVVEIVDPSSFQTIISPSYANLNNKRAISPQKVLDLYTEFNYFQGIHQNQTFKTQYEQNLIWVDNTPYFIIGIGITPDFSFPIIDHTRPIPIPKDEAIVYTNSNGYLRMVDAFRNNPRENYFSIKFNGAVNESRQTQIMEEIEKIARSGQRPGDKDETNQVYLPRMHWPSNIKIITRYNEDSDQVILVHNRILFLQNLKNTIHVLTITTTSFLIIFVSAIILLIFKSLLSIRRTKHATLMALGYSKNQIAFSMSLVTLILVGLPSVLGYIIGHFLQYPFINIFAQYWTIPTYGVAFSIVSLLITVITPLTLVFGMIFALTYWDLNEKVSDMLAGKSHHKFIIVKKLLRPLSWTSVKAKYVMSLTLTNFGRLILSALAGVLSVSALVVGLSSIGRAEYAFNQTIGITDYTYQTNLWSPTVEGGQYHQLDYEAALEILKQQKKDWLSGKSSASQSETIQWHIPSPLDMTSAWPAAISDYQAAQTFLKNKLQFKPLMDLAIGDINLWDIAKKLMPENQRNTADVNEQNFYKLAVQTLSKQNDLFLQNNAQPKWWPRAENNWTVKPEDKMVDFGVLDPEFIAFVYQGLDSLWKNNADFSPYIISYNVILMDKNTDQTYTHINTDLNGQNYSIIGVDRNTDYLKLSQNTIDNLKEYEDKYEKSAVWTTAFPLAINKYMAEKHHLKVGSEITLPINNHYDRNQPSYKELSSAKKAAKFQIIDILNSYDNDRLITSQTIANKILGLDYNNDSIPFNGFFSKSAKPLLLQTLPLYSEINLYIASDTITGPWRGIVNKMIDTWKDNPHLKHIQDIETLIQSYSITPLVAMFNKVVSQDINNTTFKNISSLASSVIWIVQVISIVLSILFAIIVSSLLISSNNKKIATLWTLGYKRSEVMHMFCLIYLLPIILSLALGVPIALGVLTALRLFVINFGSILIPFALAWWAVLIALLFIGSIFVFSTVISIMTIKNSHARKSIQEQ